MEEAKFGDDKSDWHCPTCWPKHVPKEDLKDRLFAVQDYSVDALKPHICGLVGVTLDGVDDDGFIYVADVGNQRIQKFAP